MRQTGTSNRDYNVPQQRRGLLTIYHNPPAGIVRSGRVVEQRFFAGGRALVADTIEAECINIDRRIVRAGGIAAERSETGGRVVRADGVAKKRVHAVGRVLGASGVTLKRTYSGCRVEGPSSVV